MGRVYRGYVFLSFSKVDNNAVYVKITLTSAKLPQKLFIFKLIISLWLATLGVFPMKLGVSELHLPQASVLPSSPPDASLIPQTSIQPQGDSEKVEVINTASGKIVEVSQSGAEHGRPFIRCTDLSQGCLTTPQPRPTLPPLPSPIIPRPSVLPTIIPLPSIWPCPEHTEWVYPCVKPVDLPVVDPPPGKDPIIGPPDPIVGPPMMVE